MISEFPIRQQSGGDGKFRGGNVVVRKIRFLDEMLISLLSSRRRNPFSGIKGGGDGAIGYNQVVKKDGKIIELNGIDRIMLEEGDILWIEAPGGGGYRSPK